MAEITTNKQSPTDDLVSLRRYARRGDAEALDLLIRRYQEMVLATCRRTLANETDAEDAAQETFLKFARGARSIRSNVAAWLHRCAIGTSQDIARSNGARRRAEAVSLDRKRQHAAGDPDLVWKDIEPIIDQAIQELDESDRDLIVARFLARRPIEELANEAGVSVGTMSRRVRRVIGKLETKLIASGATLAGTGLLVTALETTKAASISPALSASLGKIALTGALQSGSGLGLKISSGAALLLFVGAGVLFATSNSLSVSTPTAPSNSEALMPTAAVSNGPPRPKKAIGPFVITTTSDDSFTERGVWIGPKNMSIRHGLTLEGEVKLTVLRRLETYENKEDGGATILARVESISPVDDIYSRFTGVGQILTIDARFDEKGRMVLSNREDVQFGRNEPRWFGVRPPIGWEEHGDIPDDAGEFGILGPWAEAERVPVTIDSREILFGTDSWALAIYRIVEWTELDGYSRVRSVHAGGRDPRLISSRFSLIIKEDENGYTIAYFPPGSGRENDWPSSFEHSTDNPVRVVSFRSGK